MLPAERWAKRLAAQVLQRHSKEVQAITLVCSRLLAKKHVSFPGLEMREASNQVAEPPVLGRCH